MKKTKVVWATFLGDRRLQEDLPPQILETRLFFKITHLRTNLHNLLTKKGSYATLRLIYYKNNLNKCCSIELFQQWK